MSDSGPADFFASLAKGAAIGATLGPIGAGVGAAAAVVASLSDATGLTKYLFGDKAEETKALVQTAVVAATGSTTPDGQSAALEADPAVVANLRLRLAEIAAQRESEHDAAQLETLKATLADVANARDQTLTLAKAGSVLAWGAPAVSMGVLTAYVILTSLVVYLVATQALTEGAMAILTTVLGSLTALSATVVAYWVGSSAGSVRKSDTIERISGKPPPVA